MEYTPMSSVFSKKSKKMLIGEISNLTGFSKDTIRWYEKIGLIKLDKKARYDNNYRNYDKKIADQLLLIKQMKSFGFTLKEVEELLILDKIDELNCGNVSEIMDPKLKVIDEKIRELQNLKSRLVLARTSCTGNCKEALGVESTL